MNAALELGLKMAAQRGGSSLENSHHDISSCKNTFYSGLDYVTPYFRPLLLGWWVGALTTEGHDLFTLIKNIAKPMAIKIHYSIL